MEALPKEITDEIRFILEGCRDGRLKHDQSWYHCGTAHCIAGWKAVLDYAKAKKKPQIVNDDFSNSRTVIALEKWCEIQSGGYESQYAMNKWQLTWEEARRLFNHRATFPEQFAFLEKLEKGQRFKES